MNGFLRFNEIRRSTAAFAVLAVFTLAFGAGVAMADDIGGEDIVVPPPAAPPPAPPPPPVEDDRFKLYLTGIVGYTWAKGEADGYNECCFPFFPRDPRKNGGDDWDTTVFGGGALGIDADLGPVGLRFEIEGQGGRNYDMKTTGPVFAEYTDEMGIENAPYRSDISTSAMFVNIFVDLPLTDTFDIYAGGGVGFGVHDFKVTQKTLGVSENSHDDLEFAWQVGTGMAYDVADWLTLDLGYRYVRFGHVDVYLEEPLGGEYELDLSSHDMILGIRINYYSF
jgi:opacity protein-like surface antigen